MDMNAITAAIQAVMTPLLTRIEAVERASLSAPRVPTTQRTGTATTPATLIAGPTTRASVSQPARSPTMAAPKTANPQGTAQTSQPHTTPHPQNEGWTAVTNKRKRKRGGKKQEQANQPLQQIILTPRSYATAAAAAPTHQADKQPLPAPTGDKGMLPFTEVTILRSGGSMDNNREGLVRARPPDAIVREVKTNISRAVAKPLPIIAGRWSSGSRSRGNFVFTMKGQIDFATIQKFEHFLVAPFPGGGQLCPNQGWTKLIAHGVPVLDNDDSVFGPDDLLKEVRTMTGLHNAYFSSPPRWIKPIEKMSSSYSSLTFAYSDPDGAITKQILGNKQALFGKQVQIERWVDKPLLLQCGRCHTLGHAASSKACRLPPDSVRCHICGKGHLSEAHNRECPRAKQHKVAGTCDCKPLCITCNKVGHHARDPTCPARDGFRLRRTRPSPKSKGKEKAPPPPDPTVRPSAIPSPQLSPDEIDALNMPDTAEAGPSSAPLRNPLRTDLSGPGLSPEEAAANTVARALVQLFAAGVPLPAPSELTAEDKRTHLEEERRRMSMSMNNQTTWEDVAEIDYFIQGERIAQLPSGYFHPGMPENRRTQLAVLVPHSASLPTKTPTPGLPATQPHPHYG
jgi:hypothetical protein